jgi:MFS family permease
MSGIAADGGSEREPATRNLGRRRAAGIYGAIVTAAILDPVGGHVSTAALAVSVVVTLLVYWLAEEYADVLGEQVEGGRLPSRASIGAALATTWPMVSASFAPLVALVLARAAGASALTAANVGLVAAVLLLTFHGWLAGRAAQLRGWQLFFATSFAAALGLVMILLKDLVLTHLH